jgi:membrane-associated phospholipid phosphatase
MVRLRWWREVTYSLAFYAAYSVVRDVHGTRPVSRLHAFANAERIIDVERFFGLFQERRIQAWVLPYHLVVRSLDDFYGTAHFVITLGVLIFLFRWQPWRYPLWRNTLAITTALALLGFAFFPLMPPRLLPSSYHIVDTLHTIGGLWSFDSGPMNAVSNQYAAMPSLHFAWSLWCALALAPAMRRRSLKALVWCYPLLTLVCIVVTGNHYLLDAIGGALTLALGYGGARLIAAILAGRRVSHDDAVRA